jgi:predicted phosphodiesterase
MSNIKIGLVSDLHSEFWHDHHFQGIGRKIQQRLHDADLILLAGDIGSSADSVTTARRLFPDKPVCLIAGNHEAYGADHAATLLQLRDAADATNVYFLQQNDFVTMINGTAIRVLGATLWTDFDLFGTPDLSMLDGRKSLNDFRLVEVTGGFLTPQQTVTWHNQDKAWLLAELDKPFDGLTVVMTHHAPVNFAIPPKYVGDRLSPCFASKLDNLFVRDDVALVVWGHTHHSVDRTIDNTRFVSNQTGYPTGPKQTETGDYGIIIAV